jgi:uncharacterized protein YcnI
LVRGLVISIVALALVLPSSAAAHLSVEPAFLASGSKQRIALTVHNDRDETMTGFRLETPGAVRIIGTGGAPGWNELIEGQTASWSGGTVPPNEPVTFEIDLEAISEPGTVDLQGDQLYADGEAVRWPLTLTIVPPGGGPLGVSDGLGGAAVAILVVLGGLVVALAAVVVWQRRREQAA